MDRAQFIATKSHGILLPDGLTESGVVWRESGTDNSRRSAEQLLPRKINVEVGERSPAVRGERSEVPANQH
jgi:hypothetical protein